MPVVLLAPESRPISILPTKVADFTQAVVFAATVPLTIPGRLEVKHEGSPRARNAQHWPHAVEWYAAWRAAHFPVSG